MLKLKFIIELYMFLSVCKMTTRKMAVWNVYALFVHAKGICFFIMD